MIKVMFTALSFLICALPVRTEEQRSFCGKPVGRWIEVLRDKTSRERPRAARALSYFGPAAKGAVPDLIEALRDDPDGRLGVGAVEALGRIGPDAGPAVPLLIRRF